MNPLPQLLIPVSAAARTAAVLGLAALPEIGFILQITSVGTLVGALVALRAKRRFAHADTWAITTAWTGLALLVGLMIALAAAIA